MFDLKTFLFVVSNVILQIGFLHGKGIDAVFKKKNLKLPRMFGITPLANWFSISGSSIFKIRICYRFQLELVHSGMQHLSLFGGVSRQSFGYSEMRHFRPRPPPRHTLTERG